MTPLFNYVLLKSLEEKNESGLVEPDTVAKERPVKAKVVSVGPDVKSLSEGDTVIFKKYAPDEFSHDGEDYLLIEQEDIMLKV